MKQILNTLVAIIIFSSCNNAVNEQPVTQLEIPVKEKEMKDAIEKYPDSIALRDALIEYYYNNGNFDMALSELNNAILKDSNNASFWDKKGRLYVEYGDTANAIKSYQKAISIFPDPQFIKSIAWIYAQIKDSNALVMANALLIGKNAHAEKEALLIKGLYFRANGDKQKALSFFDDCLALEYTFMLAYKEKAVTLYDMGKYNEAIKVLKKAVTLQNNFAEGYYWMGRCFEKLNKTNEAIENYNNTLFYNKDYDDAKDALGKLGVK